MKIAFPLLFLMMVIMLLFSIPSAFALYSPTQPNAVASYNNGTNQIQVAWDFNSVDVNDTCLLKGDFYFYTDLNSNYGYNAYTTTITGFIPIHYSVVSSSPVTVNSGTTEVIPCTGSTRIDLDTVMSHESNVSSDGVTPHQELQIFLSFYATDTPETFSFGSSTFMDEIFVFYTPNEIWTEDALDYACAGQIGNVLYIDASSSDGSLITHGNNGDNCDQYLYIENFEWVDIGGANNGDVSLTDGEVLYGTHPTNSFTELIEVATTTEGTTTTTTGGGGCSGDCTDPTFYKNDNGAIIVQNGFEFNGNATDVIDYHVPYDLITVNTNQSYNMKIKVYESSLKWIGVYFGLPEIGATLASAESEAVFHINYDNEIVEIGLVDKNALIDIINSTVIMTDCGFGSECHLLDFNFVFRDQLMNNVVGIQAVDNNQNEAVHFVNDGITQEGESMNEPLISYVSASMGGAFYPQDRGVVELTLISYKNGLWQDTFGYMWMINDYGFYIIDTVPTPIKEPDVMWNAMTRMNSNFPGMIIQEQQRAVMIFDSSKLVSTLGESFAYDFSTSKEQYNKELAIKLQIEAEKAIKLTKDYTKNQYLYQKDSYDHWNYYGDMSVSEINQLNMEKKLNAQQEIYQSKLDFKGR